MTKKIFALVMVVSILGVFLAGCSKGDDSTPPATTATTTGTTTAGATTPPATTTGDAKTTG